MRLATLFIVGCFLIGCDEAPTSTTSNTSTPSRSVAPPPPPPVPGAEQAPVGDPEPEVERVVAEAGVGKKGRNYGGGVITEPVKQYFQISQRIHFTNMEHAMKLYRAEHGKLPQSHDEFMEKIIKPNGIELPELPSGQRYVFDPKRGELMVEKPKG